MFITSDHWRNVFGSLPALRMAQGPQRRSLAVSGARLCGSLACGGLQTLLALMILSVGQQRVTREAGAGCHSVGVAAAGWVESGSECRCVRRAEIEEAPDDGKRRPLALPMFRQLHRWRWSAQARLMGDEFSKHWCLGQECGRLLEAAEKTVSRSFLCLWFVVS